MHELTILLLLGIANGAPIIVRNLLADRLSMPIDAGRMFLDKPLFGPSKTIRGIVAALILTSLAAILLGLPALTGVNIALLAMFGDLISSFIKRRLNRPPSSMFLGLDQIPESLLPLIYYKYLYDLDWNQVWLVLVSFVVLELLISKILFALKIRKHPY